MEAYESREAIQQQITAESGRMSFKLLQRQLINEAYVSTTSSPSKLDNHTQNSYCKSDGAPALPDGIQRAAEGGYGTGANRAPGGCHAALLFSAMTMKRRGKAALAIVEEMHRHFAVISYCLDFSCRKPNTVNEDMR